MHPVIALLFAASAMTFGEVSAENARFTTQEYPLLGNNHVAADFNGDGRLDLAGTGANAVSAMLNNGTGAFSPKTDFAIAAQTQAVAAGDFDGNGKMDLVVTLNDSQFSFALLTGTGTGSFNAPVYFPNTSGFDSPAVIATDLNNDGKLDLVILHTLGCFTPPCSSAHSITVLLGNGNATFQSAQEIDVGVLPHAMAVGDFNGNGIQDLAIGGEKTELRILLGLGDGTFIAQPIMQLVPGGDLFSACNDVDVADFNGNGIQDLVVPLGNGRGNAILIGNGNGTFQVTQRITINESFAPLNVAVADYNRDGFADIARAMGDGTNGLVEILHGNGNGTFQSPVSYLVPPPQSSIGGFFITSSDFSGDDKPDIALEVGGASPALQVLLNSTAAATDTVSITRAEYRASTRILRVEATSTRADATLQVFVTSSNQLIGTLTSTGRGRFRGQFSWPVNPQNITVRSNFGGQAMRNVTVR